MVLCAPALAGSRPAIPAAGAAQPSTRQVQMVAERFHFSPSRITVPVGTTLELDVISEDTLHGFRIQGTEVNVAVPKRGRGSVRVTFRAEKPGSYTFECSRMCGAGHNFMRGEIRVVEATAR
jgi:cytochrome c oxidase subunit 2